MDISNAFISPLEKRICFSPVISLVAPSAVTNTGPESRSLIVQATAEGTEPLLLPGSGAFGNYGLISLGKRKETAIKQTPTGIRMTFNTDAPGSVDEFSGGGVQYPQPFDLAKAAGKAKNLWFSLRGDVSAVKFEVVEQVENAPERKAVVQIKGIGSASRVVGIPLESIREQGVNPKRVKFIFWIIEGGGKRGAIDISFSTRLMQRGQTGEVKELDLQRQSLKVTSFDDRFTQTFDSVQLGSRANFNDSEIGSLFYGGKDEKAIW